MRLPGTEWSAELRTDDERTAFHDIWESNVYQLGHNELAGTVVLDIGANIGLFTAYALARGAKHVIAVDPIAEHAERARQMLRDSRVAWVTAAAGNGSAQLLGPGEGITQTTVFERWKVEAAPAEERIDGVSLDGLVAAARRYDESSRIIAKIDCEGCEYDLICGASYMALRNIWRIAMEWHGNYGARNMSAAGKIGAMVERLIPTHSVSIFGNPDHGGILYGYSHF